jgi:WhiB family transcriptional regulator, redox-sensing transcriptional regulator
MRNHHVIAGLPDHAPGAVRQAGLQHVAVPSPQMADLRRPLAGPLRQAASLRRPRANKTLLCQGEPDLFFSEDPQSLRLAKALCEHCPVRDACLAGALERGEPWGVWGGQLFQNGRVIAEKRGRGRPRKAVAA